ncbi:MAG: peptide chain release factor N(5)-glutamine methyltransferase [bacterium]
MTGLMLDFKVTVRRVLAVAQRFIPRSEAEYLMTGLLGLSRFEIYLSERRLTPAQAHRFYSLVKRAAAGMPVQYLVNRAPFLDLDIYVDRRVFIPRPETEELVLRAVQRVKDPKVIVDYGTGSGCIALALARMFPFAMVFGVDASRAALEVAQINIERYKLNGRVRLIQAKNLGSERLRFLFNRVDLLISNPPYIPSGRLPRLCPKVRDYEPRSALDGGENGTFVIEMILNEGRQCLGPGGVLAVEIDATHGQYIRRTLAGAEVEFDLHGHVRYAFWQKRGQDENRFSCQLE